MAKITHYDQGDIWIPQATFTVNGAVTDPTNVTLKYKNPSGTVTTVGPVSGATGGSGITRVSQGVFNYQITLDDAGYWFARFEGTGTAAAAEDHEAIVDPSEFYESAQLGARALVGLRETKDWLNQQNIDTSNDLDLARVISDISDRMIEESGNREFKVFGTNPAIRSFDATESAVCRRIVAIGDLTSYTQVRILDRDGNLRENVSLSEITSLPRNRAPWEPIRQLRFSTDVTRVWWEDVIEVTGTWGFPSVPGNLRQAVLDAVVATLDRDVESYRQDLAPVTGQGEATNVIVLGSRPAFLSLPASALAVAMGYRDILAA